MRKQIKYIGSVISISLLVTSCLNSEFEPLERTEGDADFTHYVSVGNSLTQGYQDGGLHDELGQQNNSYPAIIARQMAKVNPDMDEFIQPLVAGHGSGHRILVLDSLGELTVTGWKDSNGDRQDPSWDTWTDNRVKYNNLGVAGIAVWQIMSRNFQEQVINHATLGGVGLLGGDPLNPYGRFLDFGKDPTNFLGSGDTYDYIHHIKQSGATFFTCWLGNNDVLGWSINGGDPGEISIAGFGILETTKLTEVDEFREKYDSALVAFYNMGAKGICATLPDVTSIPMLSTVNEEFLGETELWITEGASGNVRKKVAGDLITLYALDSIRISGEGLSQSKPLRHTYVLDVDEVAMVQQRTNDINAVIAQLAGKYNFGVVDMYRFLKDFNSGFYLDGVNFSAKYIEGGVFSLDGIHPNTKGYAIVANFFIDAINEKYGSSIPRVNVNEFRGIVFPND
ncbi:MAG: hypothetical protein H6600_02655 [Flavobacteriales bacterium]|nr:hypothetical protein [Flavobacteriales bacterium]